MVAVALSDGLGNQMFQYAAGRAVALRAGLPLKLDRGILDDGDGFRRYQLDGFALRTEFLSSKEREVLLGPGATASTRRWLWRWVDYLRPWHQRRGIAEKTWRFYPELLQVRTSCHLRGHWQSERYFEDCVEVIRKDFDFAKRPGLAQEPEDEMAAALHVRRSDYLAPHTAGIHGVCPVAYYERAVAEVKRRAGAVRWHVFSDDPEWVQSQPFLKSLGEVVCGDPRAPMEDFRRMRACRHFVIANSTFSWWAAWLGEREDSVIIAPQQWFEDSGRDASFVVPDRWIRV